MPATVPSPSKRTNSWLRTTAPPVVKVKVVEPRVGADRGRQGRDVQRVGALADDLDVIDLGAVADDEFERGIDLVVDAVRALVALDQRQARAPCSTTTSERAKRRGRLVRGDEDEMQRPLDRSRPARRAITAPSPMNAVLSA